MIPSSADDLRHAHSPSDSVSASDVAEYLKEFSKGITSQVTSEIREVTNAMNSSDHDVSAASLLSTDGRRYTPPDIFEKQSFPVTVVASAKE